jgi:acetyl-CoA synthetase
MAANACIAINICSSIQSIGNPEAFWQLAGRLTDNTLFKIMMSVIADDFRIRWFYDGQLNWPATVDRHLRLRDHKTAIIWEGDDPTQSRHISYRELYERVCQCANALRSLGVKKGDRVTIYLPMIPEIAISMLACARIGAIHSVVFGGFSPDSLAVALLIAIQM